jgi:hypothetical protein
LLASCFFEREREGSSLMLRGFSSRCRLRIQGRTTRLEFFLLLLSVVSASYFIRLPKVKSL